MKLKKAIGFLVFMFMVMLSLPSVGYAEEQQYTENLIPAMTSDTSPSGEVTSGGAQWPGWQAFDHNISSGGAGLTKKPYWLAYEFPTNQIINKYTLRMLHAADYSFFPVSWTFEAWDDEKWIVLDSRNNIRFSNSLKTEKRISISPITNLIRNIG